MELAKKYQFKIEGEEAAPKEAAKKKATKKAEPKEAE